MKGSSYLFPGTMATLATASLCMPGECRLTFVNKEAAPGEEPLGGPWVFQLCKEYQSDGVEDDLDRTFYYTYSVEPVVAPYDYPLSGELTITLDEGAVNCTSPMTLPPTSVTVTEHLDQSAGFVSDPDYPQVNVEKGGTSSAIEGSSATMAMDEACTYEQPCVLRFVNKQAPEGASEPADANNSIMICKHYQQGGPLDDFGREFDFSLYIDEAPLGNADVIVDFTITVDEGQSNCTDAMQIPAEATIGVHEIGSAGFTNHPDYPQYELIQFGQQVDFGQGSLFFFNNENDCQPETPCVVNFFNKPVDDTEFPIRICKTLVDNGDGYQRPDTTFTFNANWTQTTITVAEGETECVVVWAQPSPDNGILTVSEVLLPGFEQAPGFMKRKLDTYPLQSTPDMGIHAGSILLKLDDGCYEPYVPIEGGLGLVREVMSVVIAEATEPVMCTVYFFNQEVPNNGPECEVDCGEPECEVDCGTEPECQVNCEPPCTVHCGGEPDCEASCDEPQCIDCDPTPTPETPTPTPETPTVPNEPQTTPEPEEEVEGEATPGPQATPKAPDAGSSLETSSGTDAAVLATVSLVLLIGSLGLGVAELTMRRRR